MLSSLEDSSLTLRLDLVAGCLLESDPTRLRLSFKSTDWDADLFREEARCLIWWRPPIDSESSPLLLSSVSLSDLAWDTFLVLTVLALLLWPAPGVLCVDVDVWIFEVCRARVLKTSFKLLVSGEGADRVSLCRDDLRTSFASEACGWIASESRFLLVGSSSSEELWSCCEPYADDSDTAAERPLLAPTESNESPEAGLEVELALPKITFHND